MGQTVKRACLAIFALLIIPLLLSASSGCFFFQDDYPDDSCQSNNDCFRSQGEVCNLDTNRCEVPGGDGDSDAGGDGDGDGDGD